MKLNLPPLNPIFFLTSIYLEFIETNNPAFFNDCVTNRRNGIERLIRVPSCYVTWRSFLLCFVNSPMDILHEVMIVDPPTFDILIIKSVSCQWLYKLKKTLIDLKKCYRLDLLFFYLDYGSMELIVKGKLR